MIRKNKETKEFTGKEVYTVDVRHNQYSADIVISYVKVDERGEHHYHQAIISPYIIANIIQDAGLLFTAEKSIKRFHVKDYEFFAGG